MIPSLTAISNKKIGAQKSDEEIFVDRPFIHHENDSLELPLYKSWYTSNDNLSCMLSWFSVKMLVRWNIAKVIFSEINSQMTQKYFII